MEAYIEEKLNQFNNYFTKEKYEDAKNVCIEVISDSKLALANRFENSESENNLRYIAGITFKGFAEFCELHLLTKTFNWQKDNKKVEEIWNLMCDCSEHLNFSATTIESAPLTAVLERLKKFSRFFSKTFGKGLYMSPVIIIEDEICSICNFDVRTCEHREGRLYNGVICKRVANKISNFKSVDFVKVPKDPRCRVWPWNEKEKGVYDVRILNMNNMDDFLYENI